MLVLSRHLNESIIIAKEIKVTVLRITPTRVELGVDAESDVLVDREEIHLRRQAADAATGGKRKATLKVAVPRVNGNR